MGCGCKNAEGGCGCGTKEMNWESYDKPSFTKTMMARTRPMECDFCGGTDEVGYADDGRTLKVCEHCDVDGSNYPGWNRKKAEEPVVQEPDWIPQGDGRAIGQQDFAINLSPLHAENEDEAEMECSGCGKDVKKGDKFYFVDGAWTRDVLCVSCKEEGDDEDADWGKLNIKKGSFDAESRFDKLSNEIADEYEEKGMSHEKAQEVGDATAAKIGRAKYGKTGMRNMQKKGMRADMVGNPSPTFNEDITGQDGPSADPTNQTFEAMRTLAPSSTDVTRARRDLKNSGYGDVIYDRYMVYRDGSSNKFYYTAVTEKDGKYYPMGAYGRIGYLSKLFNIYGKTEGPRASLSTMDAAYRQCSGKEKAKIKKGYVDYTLQMAESFGSETLAQIEGPTAEATTGGLHAPSSFAMTWEDGTGQSSASIPPNEIAWAEETKGAETKIFGIGLGTLVVGALGIFGVKKLMDKKSDTASGDDTKKAEKGCGCSKTVAKSETVRKHSEYSADRINPVEVEGQNDIHNAESISLQQPNAGPQTAHRQSNRPSLKLW
jgi:predicted DNA-binding WGR domain protein